MVFVQLATDSFDRANNADLGANWDSGYVTGYGSFEILSNLAHPSVAGTQAVETYNAITWPNDQYSEFDISTWANENQAVSIVRLAAPSTVTGYMFFAQRFSGVDGNDEIYKVISDSYTLLASAAGSWTTGNRMKGAAFGTGLYLFKNGTQILSASDSAIGSGRGGISGLHFSGGAGGNVNLDNWAGGRVDPDPGGVVIPVFIHHLRQQGIL